MLDKPNKIDSFRIVDGPSLQSLSPGAALDSFPDAAPPSLSASKEEVIAFASTIPGWMEPEELSWLYDTATTMDSVLEIGSFAGRSTLVLCHACPGQVISVDSYFPPEKELQHMMAKKDIKAMFDFHLQNFLGTKLTQHRIESLWASKIPDIPAKIDMIFVDGGHDFVSVWRDLCNWAHRAAKIICGHDYDVRGYPDVKRAVDEYFCPKLGGNLLGVRPGDHPDVKRGVDRFFSQRNITPKIGAHTIWYVDWRTI